MSSLVQLIRPLAGPALAETLDGGQCFRWRRSADGAWLGVSGGLVAELRPQSPNGLAATLHAGTADDLRRHVADDIDWTALADTLPWRSDPHLATCLAAFPGLRILRQPIGEALLCFLCSATKQIVQIKQMVALLASRHGRPLTPEHRQRIDDNAEAPPAGQCHPLVDNASDAEKAPEAGVAGTAARRGAAAAKEERDADAAAGGGAGRPVHALPTWAELADVPEKALRACLLGFRARHVAGVARFLAERPGWLEETAALPYAAAKARLIELPGVGDKIADCVLLFGAGRLEAFPVDVWILRVMARRYGLDGWSPAQVAHFGRVHFGPLAGLAQQYLFAWERAEGGRVSGGGKTGDR